MLYLIVGSALDYLFVGLLLISTSVIVIISAQVPCDVNFIIGLVTRITAMIQFYNKNLIAVIQLKPPRQKDAMSIFMIFFGYCLCPLGEMMKLSINKRYNGKIRRISNNQLLNIPYPSEEQRVFKIFFFFFSIV